MGSLSFDLLEVDMAESKVDPRDVGQIGIGQQTSEMLAVVVQLIERRDRESCLWGGHEHLLMPDQPDLVLIYTIGNPDDLDKLIVELRTHTTADIIVPSIHWRERDQELWGKSENAADQNVAAVRTVCAKQHVEFIAPSKPCDYSYMCSFPGHSIILCGMMYM